jgi:hypothetical protein
MSVIREKHNLKYDTNLQVDLDFLLVFDVDIFPTFENSRLSTHFKLICKGGQLISPLEAWEGNTNGQ